MKICRLYFFFLNFKGQNVIQDVETCYLGVQKLLSLLDNYASLFFLEDLGEMF